MTVTIPRGLARVRVTRAGTGVEGANVYLFDAAGSYLGRFRVTDSSGTGEFIIPEGSYKFRVDKGGVQHWTPVTELAAGALNVLEVEVD
jgi:hypothetical protein